MNRIISLLCAFCLFFVGLSLENSLFAKMRLTEFCQTQKKCAKTPSARIGKGDGMTVSVNQLKHKMWKHTNYVSPYIIERKMYTDSFIVYISTTLYSQIKKEHPNSALKETNDRTITYRNLYYLSNQKDTIFDMNKVGTDTQGKYIIFTSDEGKHIDYGTLQFLSEDSLAYFNDVAKSAIGGIRNVLQYKRVDVTIRQ